MPSGLCETCRDSRRIVNSRGSTFWRCERSDSDPRFSRYPRLPVLACPGYQPESAADESSADLGPADHR